MALMAKIRNILRTWWRPTWETSEITVSLVEQLLSMRQLRPADALAHPAIYRAVSLISADVAKVPIHLYEKMEDGSRRERNELPAAAILRSKAAPGISGYALRRTLTAHALLSGNGFAWIRRDGTGAPRALTILDPEATKVVETLPRLKWQSHIEEKEIIVDDADVLHIQGLSWNGIAGESPLVLVREAIALELAVLRFAAGYFAKGYALSGFLRSPRALSPEEVARLRDEFKRRHSSAANAHDIAILSGGIEFQPAVADAQKTQLVESRDAGVRAIANIFGLPPHKLGDPTRTSYASIEAENIDYLQTTLDQWLVAWEAELNEKMLSASQKGRFYFEHQRNAIVRTNLEQRVSAYAKLIEIGVLSPNEVREKENMDRRENGDAYYTPANWTKS